MLLSHYYISQMIDQQQYEVEQILASKFCLLSNRFYYLIKWKNWDLLDSTWQPEQNLKNAFDVIDEYKQKKMKTKHDFDWNQVPQFREFWNQQDKKLVPKKKRGRPKKQTHKDQVKKQIKKTKKKISKKQRRPIESVTIKSDDESQNLMEQQQQQISRRCTQPMASINNQKQFQKKSGRSQPTKSSRMQLPRNNIEIKIKKELPIQTKNVIKQPKQLNEQLQTKIKGNPKNIIFLDQCQKSNNLRSGLQKEQIQQKHNRYKLKMFQVVNKNEQFINQVLNIKVKKKQQEQVQQQQPQPEQKHKIGQQNDSEEELKKIIKKDKKQQQQESQQFQLQSINAQKYKVIGIKRINSRSQKRNNRIQLIYKVQNQITKKISWQNKRFVMRNCSQELIEFYQSNMEFKNDYNRYKS